MFRFLLFLLYILSTNVYAQWLEGKASVAVEDAELDEIRVMAIKNAIADAAYKNGSFITAQDIVLDGLLVSSKAQIRTQGRIQRVEIVDETQSKHAIFEEKWKGHDKVRETDISKSSYLVIKGKQN